MPKLRLNLLTLPPTTAPETGWLALLDAAERQRCVQIQRPAAQRSFVAAHALRRLALAELTGLAPAAFAFTHDAAGAPGIVLPDDVEMQLLGCSLSHTVDAVAVAVAPGCAIGVDIERSDRGDISDEMLRHGLGEADAAVLLPLPAAERAVRFYELWTVKEAVAKAEGKGRAIGFGRIRLVGTDQAEVMAQADEPARRWRIWRWQLESGHAVALAAGSANGEPELCRLDLASFNDWCGRKSARC